MKPVHTILIAALLLGSAIWSQSSSPIPDRFRRFDKDGSGKLTREEVPDAAAFDAADTDRDGEVTLEEYLRYVAGLQRTPTGPEGAAAPAPPPIKGRPVLKELPDSDAAQDAAGTGQLFECVHVPGLTDLRKGVNGFAFADLNRDGRLDFVATVSPPVSLPGIAGAKTGTVDRVPRSRALDQLVVLVNLGGFCFQPHAIRIRGSELAPESFAMQAQVPNLADFNGDGFLDLLVTRHAPMQAGKKFPGEEPLGNTFLISDGAWDRFLDVSLSMGTRNELAYNRQTSIGDVDGDGWLDIAVGCDNIGNAMGGFPHSRLFVFKPKSPRFEDGGFQDVGGSSLVPDFGGFYHDSSRDKAGPNIALRDLDNDGDLDLIQSFHVDVREPLLPYSPGEYRQGVFSWKNLRRETGQARFEKAIENGLASEASLRYDRTAQRYVPQGSAPGLPYLVFADVDNDGLQDALAVGPSDPGWSPRCEDVGGRFWKNLGRFRFEERTHAAGLSGLEWSYLDWYAFFEQPIPERYRDWRPGGEVRGQPGLPAEHPLESRPYYADAVFADFDNDGWLDLVVLDRRENPYLPTRAMLWMNRGDGTFEPKPTAFSGLDGTGISAEAADLDGDGLLDLFFAADPDNSGVALDAVRYESKVYWNTGEGGGRQNHWIHLTFSGLSDAELIGARVECTAGRRSQYRWIHSNHTYKSGGALDARFGLGSAEAADVKITLLDGRTRTYSGLSVDRNHALTFKSDGTAFELVETQFGQPRELEIALVVPDLAKTREFFTGARGDGATGPAAWIYKATLTERP